MDRLFAGWKWGAMSIQNVISVKTGRAGTRIKNHGNTVSYQLGVKFNGRSQISYKGNNVDFKPGTALFLPKEQTEDIDYTTLTVEQGMGVCIFFDSEYELPREPQTMENVGEECENAFLRLLDAYLCSSRQDSPELMAAFYGLLTALYRKNGVGGENERSDPRFEEVIRYMNRHVCDEYPDIGRMATLSGMSEKYFRDSFKSVFGISPLKYFHHLKLEHVKILIADLSLSVAEVARQSGFSDPNYFSRFFKKHLGISPREYRNYYCKRI